jgi:hypothetical protein
MARQITLPGIPFELSPELAATQEGLNQAVLELNDAWEMYETETDSLKGSDLAEDTARRFAQTAHELGQLGIDLLVRERALRLKVATYIDQIAGEHVGACDQAGRLLEEARVEIKKRLLKIGYIDGVPPGFTTLSLTPGMIMNHPMVAQRNADHLAITGYEVNATRRQNDDALSKMDHEIEKIRRQLISRVQV